MRGVWRFLIKAAVLALPVMIAGAAYVICDPYWVLRDHHFADYYDAAAPVELNRDYAGWKIFEQNYPERRYDSFILGSSRSFPFHCDVWKRYLGEEARPYHYAAHAEILIGVVDKLEYLDARGVRLSNVLVELHTRGLAEIVPRTDVVHRIPYAVSGESWAQFQMAMLGGFFTEGYFVKYLDWKLTGTVHPYARTALGSRVGDVHIDPITNDYYFNWYERELAEDEPGYYARRAWMFPPHGSTPPQCAPPVLTAEHVAKLREMKAIFDRQHTDYRWVIPPFWDQVCIARSDLAAMQSVFGADRVFDFTGVNDLSSDMRTFYDSTHVRPHAADEMMRRIYSDSRAVAR